MQNASVSKELKTSVRRSSRSRAPVFVLGCPRSGTTLLYHMLLSAGNFVVYRAESQVFNLLEPRFGDLSVQKNKCKLLTAWHNSPLFTKTGLDAHAIDAEVMDRCANGGDFLRIVMEAMARRQQVDRWADCTPDHLLYLDRIKETIPDALVLHVIRDGRDVALSMAKQAWIRPLSWGKTENLQAAALYWDWIVNKGRESGEELGADYTEVRFEDLIGNPKTTLAALSLFLEHELDYDRIQRVGIGSVSEPNSSFRTELQAGNFSPVARWKSALSSDELAVLEALVGDTLERLGYALAMSESKMRGQLRLKRIRAIYHTYFAAKFFLKAKTVAGRLFTTRDFSWL